MLNSVEKIIVQLFKGDYAILACSRKKCLKQQNWKKQDTKLYSHKSGMKHIKILIVVLVNMVKFKHFNFN